MKQRRSPTTHIGRTGKEQQGADNQGMGRVGSDRWQHAAE